MTVDLCRCGPLARRPGVRPSEPLTLYEKLGKISSPVFSMYVYVTRIILDWTLYASREREEHFLNNVLVLHITRTFKQT